MRSQDAQGKCLRKDDRGTETCTPKLPMLKQVRQNEIAEEMKERDWEERETGINGSEETEEMITLPLYPYLLQG